MRPNHTPSPRTEQTQYPLLPTAVELAPYLAQIDSSRRYSNYGQLARQFERRLAQRFGCGAQCIVTASSGTTALRTAILGHAGMAQPDRPLAILPSYTFTATAQALISCGYRLHFADVDPETWMLDPERLAQSPHLRTAGLVLPVAAYGRAPDIAGWEHFQEKTGCPVVIDAAAGFEQFAERRCVASKLLPIVLSFHATKTLSSAEGGAILTPGGASWHRHQRITNFGLDEDRITDSHGLNGKLSEYHAAIGLASLDLWDQRAKRYERVAQFYNAAFGPGAGRGRFHTRPQISAAYVLFEAAQPEDANRLLTRLQAENIGCRRWYGLGLHRHPFFAGTSADPLPTTDNVSARHIGLPASVDLQEDEIARVVDAVDSATRDPVAT